MNEIRNRVTESSTLVVFDLEDYFPPAGVAEFDLAPLVSDGVMREKTCREFFKSLNCEKFRDQVVAFYCSVDAILPQWIWPMASSAVAQEALYSTSGRKPDALQAYYSQRLAGIKWEEFVGKKVLLKGCGHYPVPNSAYVQAATHLCLSAQKLMYGEACSNVLIYSNKK
tara:strand:- start:2128 stop:2634 length:507 start_codon:yes stop_codon:yes gene_type:complete